MLKRFFLNALSSFVGAWIALGLFGVVIFIVLIGIASRLGVQSTSQGLKSNSIFKITLSGSIEENEKSREIDPQELLMNGSVERPMTLNGLVQALAEAKVNKNIKLLYFDCQGVSASPATLNALREAVEDFKKSGKPVYAYADYMQQGDYFVTSLADSIFVNPRGALDLHGVGGTVPYFKDLFDKLGVTFTVCKVGTFKSAVEPYISNTMSEPARAQLDTLYGNMWRYIKNGIAKGRKIKPAELDALMNEGMTFIMPLERMVKGKLVDRLLYRRQMDQVLGRASGQDPEKLNFVGPEELISQTDWGTAYSSKRQVAVLYATGEIREGSKDGIDCETLVPVITELADDDNVKALVLRVNSPGGSVFGSEQIAEALNYFKSKGKPFVVSMGDYAASGGYWISADAERIFADPLTVTGSIGIFGLFPDISGLLAKVGVSPQTVATNPGAMPPGLMTRMTDSQRAQFQTYIDRGYDQFIERVAKGRKMSEAKVRAIAEGRVWDGETAKKLGLVDELASLGKAVEYAAGKAGLKADNYDVALYPTFEPGIWDLIPLGAELGLEKVMERYMTQVEPNEPLLRKGLEIVSRKPIQARALEVSISL